MLNETINNAGNERRNNALGVAVWEEEHWIEKAEFRGGKK